MEHLKNNTIPSRKGITNEASKPDMEFLKEGVAFGFLFFSHKDFTDGHALNWVRFADGNLYFLDAQDPDDKTSFITTTLPDNFEKNYAPHVFYICTTPPEGFKIKSEPKLEVIIKKEAILEDEMRTEEEERNIQSQSSSSNILEKEIKKESEFSDPRTNPEAVAKEVDYTKMHFRKLYKLAFDVQSIHSNKIQLGCLFLKRAGDTFSEHYHGNVLEYAEAAIAANHSDTLNILYKYKLLNVQNSEYLLEFALKSQNENMILFLMKKGCKLKDEHLNIALNTNNEAMVCFILKLLISSNGLKAEHLFQAIKKGSTTAVKFILDSKPNSIIFNGYSSASFTPLGYTALDEALRLEKDEIAILLLNSPAYLSYSPYGGNHYLAQAIMSGKSKLAKALIAKGYGINRKTDDGKTPLTLAIETRNIEIIRALAESSELDPVERRSWMIKAAKQNQELYQMLLQSGKIDHQKPINKLTLAFAIGDLKTMQEILSSKASPVEEWINLTDDLGLTVLMWAAALGQTEHLAPLLHEPSTSNPNKFLNINKQNLDGWSALMFAAAYGNKKMMDILLQFPGIRLDLRNKQWDTAADLAKRNGHTEIAKILEKLLWQTTQFFRLMQAPTFYFCYTKQQSYEYIAAKTHGLDPSGASFEKVIEAFTSKGYIQIPLDSIPSDVKENFIKAQSEEALKEYVRTTENRGWYLGQDSSVAPNKPTAMDLSSIEPASKNASNGSQTPPVNNKRKELDMENTGRMEQEKRKKLKFQ